LARSDRQDSASCRFAPLDPYAEVFAGITPEQVQAYFLADPLFQYTFGPEGPPQAASLYEGPCPPDSPSPFPETAEQGAPSNFGARLLPKTGNIEYGDPLADPLTAQFQGSLQAQSTGFAPTLANMPTTAPWAGAPQPGALPGQAGLNDIGGGGGTDVIGGL
jgi:hypothetical protein